MNKKVTSLLVVLVALCGFALAVFIPSASAEKGHNTYTQYCENGTNTVYNEYSQYCETTTASSAGTTVSTSSTQTITGTGTAGNGGAAVNYANLTQAQAYAILAKLAGVTVLNDGVVFDRSVGANIPVGIHLAPGVQVIANKNGYLTIDDNGTIFSVPYGAELVVAPDGAAAVFIFPKSSGKRVADRTVASLPKSATQYVILPKGVTSDKFSYWLATGVTFGDSTWKAVAKRFTVYKVTNLKSLRVAHTPVKVGVDVVAAANKPHSAATLKLAKSLNAYEIKFNMAGLKYTKAALAESSLTNRFSIYSVKAKKTYLDHLTFVY